MHTSTLKIVSTNDKIIRSSFKKKLESVYANNPKRIVEELGIDHGAARIDIAVINGSMHGYEIKSDRDTLQRLPEQMNIYNSVFDQITLVVGKSHLYNAVNIIPDWWGIELAKIDNDGSIAFCCIRDAEDNSDQERIFIARLLWKSEALEILENMNEARGLHYRPRCFAYERLASLLDKEVLGAKVREKLLFREGWRVDQQPSLCGG